MFANTLRLIDDAGLTYLHVFPFSPRKGTPAAKMPQLGRAVVKDRARQLREKGAAMLSQRLAALVGSDQELLVEDTQTAHTPCFASARLAAPASPGALLRGRIEASDGRNLYARVLNAAQSW